MRHRRPIPPRRPASVIGSQALLLSRAFAARALAEWPRLNGFQSQRLAALAAELAHPIHYHAPSLVQHTGKVSAGAGSSTGAVDFEGKIYLGGTARL